MLGNGDDFDYFFTDRDARDCNENVDATSAGDLIYRPGQPVGVSMLSDMTIRTSLETVRVGTGSLN